MRALVPEDIDHRAQRRSLVRAITSHALATARRTSAASVLQKAWPRDEMAARSLDVITRGAVDVLKTSDAPALAVQAVRMLAGLSPRSAALRLFADGMSVDLTGLASVHIPNVGDVQPAKFVAEGEPAPLVQFSLAGSVLGPVKKVLVLSAVTRELENASPESASQIIGRLLATSAAKGIDAIAFGNAPADDAQPAGLLHGVAGLTPTAGGGAAAMAADIANLAGEIADAGLDASGMIIVAHPRQATTLALTAGPRFSGSIYATNAMPAGTVAAFAPDAIAATVEGPPEVETSKDVVVHYEDTAPAQIASVGSPNVIAAPTLSAFQHDVIVIKCAARLTWALAAPGGAQVIAGVTW